MKMILMSGLLASAAALVTTTTDALATHGGKDNRFRNASIEWDPAGRKGPIHIFVENDGVGIYPRVRRGEHPGPAARQSVGQTSAARLHGDDLRSRTCSETTPCHTPTGWP
jgi:hypothetical protein